MFSSYLVNFGKLLQLLLVTQETSPSLADEPEA